MVYSPDVAVPLIRAFSATGQIVQAPFRQFGMVPLAFSSTVVAGLSEMVRLVLHRIFAAAQYFDFAAGRGDRLVVLIRPDHRISAATGVCWPRQADGESQIGKPAYSRTVACLWSWMFLSLVYAALDLVPHARNVLISADAVHITRYVGLLGPNVFNESDLRMGDAWACIAVETPGKAPVLLPFNDAKGRRSWWHNGDLIYFGNSLRQRRDAINSSPVEFFADPALGGRAIAQIVQFDYRLNDRGKDAVYTVDAFTSDASRVALEPKDRFAVKKTGLYKIVVRNGHIAEILPGQASVEPLKMSLVGRDTARLLRKSRADMIGGIINQSPLCWPTAD